jgi:integrase
VWKLIAAARKQAGPSYAAWLQVACFTGMRPGELDALQWDAVDLEHGRILVREQFNAKTRSFTLPKNGQKRSAPLTGQAREVLVSLPRTSRFCFPSLRGGHWTASAGLTTGRP